MDFGVTDKLREYYLAGQYRKNAATGAGGGVGFAELAAAKAAGQPDVSGMSFKDMWQARYPGAYYHVTWILGVNMTRLVLSLRDPHIFLSAY